MGTEARNPRSFGIDRMSAAEIVRLMDEEEHVVFQAVRAAADSLALAAERAADAFKSGGRIVYVGAGTSGRIAAADAAEMGPTFGVPEGRFVALMAGGDVAAGKPVEEAEDDEHAVIEALNRLEIGKKDVVFGIAASGNTPYTVAAVRHAHQKGVWSCGIANRKHSPLLKAGDLGILLATGPEVITGSTRLKAGTAQKMALNRISTTAMVLCGKVIENLMVDLRATNHKLKERCVRIVRELTPATADEAADALERHGWHVREAVEAIRASGAH